MGDKVCNSSDLYTHVADGEKEGEEAAVRVLCTCKTSSAFDVYISLADMCKQQQHRRRCRRHVHEIEITDDAIRMYMRVSTIGASCINYAVGGFV